MLRPFLLLFSAVFIIAAPARADQLITYSGDGDTLVLRINDAGDAEVVTKGKEGRVLVIGGTTYLVTVEEEEARVARLSDIAAVMEEEIGPVFKGLFALAEEAEKDAKAKAKSEGRAPEETDKTPQKLVIEAGEQASFAGYEGQAFKVSGLSDNEKGPEDWIITQDPALAPAGAALRTFIESQMMFAAAFLGPLIGDMIDNLRQVFALGTPLKGGDKFALQSIEDIADDPERFKLPARPATRAEIKAEMKTTPTLEVSNEKQD